MTQLKYIAEITDDVTDQVMVNDSGNSPAANGTPAGVRIDLGTATTVDVTISDDIGPFFVATSVTADTNYAVDATEMQRTAVSGVPKVTTANISDPAHTLDVHLQVKE